MTAYFYRWKADPFFLAAEEVQDSADRMESAYRAWLHDRSLAGMDPIDTELADSIEFQRRELITALGTARWQLEDFERAVKWTPLADQVDSSKDASSRHKQFIAAIQNQIAVIEEALQDRSTNNDGKSPQWVDLDEQDRDDLAMFLSGSGFCENAIEHSKRKNITETQLKGNISVAANVRDTEDMVELRLDDAPMLREETQESNLQGVRLSDMNGSCALDNHINSFKGMGLIRKDSESAGDLAHRVDETRDDWDTGASLDRATGHKRSASAGAEFGAWKIAIADDDTVNKTFNCRSEYFPNGSNFWRLLNNLKFTPKLKLSKSSMKRWKDGEMSALHHSNNEQQTPSNGGINTWLGSRSTILNGQHLPSEDISDDKQLHGLIGAVQRRLLRSHHFIQYSHRRPVQLTSAVLVTLIVLENRTSIQHIHHDDRHMPESNLLAKKNTGDKFWQIGSTASFQEHNCYIRCYPSTNISQSDELSIMIWCTFIR